jgi:uncharacterized protein
MDIHPGTKIDDLLKKYPFLVDFFLTKSPKFKHLTNPIMRRTVGKVATLNQIASIGKMEIKTLLEEIAGAVREKTGESIAIIKDAVPAPAEPLHDSSAREDVLKDIIRDLHKGEDPEKLKERFRQLIRDVSPF